MSAPELLEKLTKCTTHETASVVIAEIMKEIKEAILETLSETHTASEVSQIVGSPQTFECAVNATLAYAMVGFAKYIKE